MCQNAYPTYILAHTLSVIMMVIMYQRYFLLSQRVVSTMLCQKNKFVFSSSVLWQLLRQEI